MTRNMGGTDRTVRGVVALTIAALLLGGTIDGILALVLGGVALVFAATALIGWCPLYAPFRFSTKRFTGTGAAR